MKPKKAFTLVELLVVIAIIGILATISVIALNSARAKSRDAKRVADVKQINTALELFFNDAGRYPTDQEWSSGSLEYGSQTYLSIIPGASSPADGSCDDTTNSFSYTQDNSGESYTLTFCTGGVVGSLTAGELCATPSGIAACSIGGGTPPFVCGDQITITSLLGHTCDTDAPDYDTCTYDTIQIGAQCWLAGNMNVGTYVISSEDQDDDSNLEKYCYNNDTDNCLSYGALYQWDETMQYSTSEGAQGICPTGWHIPSDAEQNTLDQYLTDLPNSCDPARIDTGYIDGECANAGTKLAIGGSSGFNWPIAGFYKSSFQSLSAWTYIWSSSISGQSAYFRGLLAGQPTVYRVYDNWNVGVSVRCLQD